MLKRLKQSFKGLYNRLDYIKVFYIIAGLITLIGLYLSIVWASYQ